MVGLENILFFLVTLYERKALMLTKLQIKITVCYIFYKKAFIWNTEPIKWANVDWKGKLCVDLGMPCESW